MKKLITILFGVMIMSFGLMSCMPNVDTSNEGENSEITNPNGNGESGNGSETTTVTFEDYTYNITCKDSYYTRKIDDLKIGEVNVPSMLSNTKAYLKLYEQSKYLYFTYDYSNHDLSFELKDNKLKVLHNPYENAITVDITNKTVSITIDYTKL